MRLDFELLQNRNSFGRYIINICLVLLFALAVGSNVLAATTPGAQTITLDGRLTNPAGDAGLIDSSIVIDIKIFDPQAACVLYEEHQTVDTTQTDGRFTLLVGSAVGASKRTGSDVGNPMVTVFSNYATILGGGSCTYTPQPGDTRLMRVTVAPQSTGTVEVLSPDTVIDQVPNSLVAETLQGLDRDHVLAIDSTTTLSQANVANIFSSSNYSQLLMLLAGTSGSYVNAPASGGAKIPSVSAPPSTPAAGQIWFNSTANSFQYYNGSSVQTIGTSGAGISSLTVGSSMTAGGTAGGTLNGPGTIDLVNSGVVAGTYPKVTVNSKGLVSYGTALIEGDIPNLTSAGHVSGNAIIAGTIGGTTAFYSSGNVTTSGTVTGTTVSSGIDSTRQIQLFDPAGGSTHKILISAPTLANDYSLVFPATAGSAGYALTTDGSGNLSWANPASNTLPGLGSGKIWIGNSAGVAAAVTPYGDVSLSLAGSATVTQLQGYPVSPAVPAVAGGQVLRWTAGAWTPSYIAMSDLRSVVTGASSLTSCASNQTLVFNSVTDSLLCSLISIANSQITWGSTGANLVFAGPASGAVAAPTFRTLTPADLPAGVASQWSSVGSTINYVLGAVGIGTATPQAMLDIYSTGTNSALLVPRATIAQRPTSPVNGMIRYQVDGNSLEAFTGGAWNTLATNAVGGGSSQWVTAGANIYYGTGNVGIGVSNPNFKLDVAAGPSDGIRLQDLSGNYKSWLLNDGGNGELRLYSGASVLGTYLAGTGTSYFNGGNLGIGTNAATAPLTVNGMALIGNSDLQIEMRDTAGTPTDPYNQGVTTFSGADRRLNLTSLQGSLRQAFVLADATVTTDTILGLSSSSDSGATWQPRFNVSQAGSVGIGTNVPQAFLDVNGSGSSSAMLVPRDSTLARPTGVNGMVRYNTDIAKLELFGSGSWSSIATGGSTGSYLPLAGGTLTGPVSHPLGSASAPSVYFGDVTTGLYSTGNGNISFTSGSSTKLAIAPSGAIGISTANPTNTYATIGTMVQNGGGFFSSQRANDVGYHMFNGGGVAEWLIHQPNHATSDSLTISKLIAGSATDLFAIAPSGSVSIGTSSTNTKLDVQGGARFGARIGSESSLATAVPATQGAYIGWNENSGSGATSFMNNSGLGAGGFDFSFYSSGGTYVSTPVTISGGGNVGIGTTTPLALLDITGTGTNSALLLPRAAVAQRPTGVNGMIRYQTDTNSLETFANGAWSAIATSAIGGGASQWTSNSANIYYGVGSGNVGIGTGSPNFRLDVEATTGTGVVDIGSLDGSANGGSIYFTSLYPSLSNTIKVASTITGEPDNGAGGRIKFHTTYPGNGSASERMRIDAYGNVGIGTTQPTNLLHVYSSVGGTVLTLQGTGGGDPSQGGQIRMMNSNAPSAVQSKYVRVNASGTFQILNSAYTASLFAVQDGGNVGIGTSTPAGILDLYGVGTAASAVVVPRDTTAGRPSVPVNGMLRYNTDVAQLEAYSSGAWNGVVTSAVGGGASQWTTSGSNIYFNSTGNVGIGTASPTDTLHVMGNIRIPGTSALSLSGIGQFIANASGGPAITTGGSGPITFSTSATERMRIDGSGNVAIGTTTATGTLTIGSGQILGAVGSVSAPAIAFTNSTNSGFYAPAPADFRIANNGSDRFRSAGGVVYIPANLSVGDESTVPLSTAGITGNLSVGSGYSATAAPSSGAIIQGNVGIGTTSPSSKFHVYAGGSGMTYVGGFQTTQGTGAGNTVAIGFVNEWSGTWYKGGIAHERLGNYGVGTLHFLNSDAMDTSNADLTKSRLAITSIGNVGIGTTSPQTILDVNGSGTSQSAMIVPRDSTAARPTGVNGMIRYNTTLGQIEAYASGAWGGALSQWSNGSSNNIVYNNIIPSTDPNRANVKLLMHMDGANSGTSFPDSTGIHAATASTAQTSTTQVKFGTTSGYFGGGGSLSVSPVSDLSGSTLVSTTTSFTIEMWVYLTSYPTGTTQALGFGDYLPSSTTDYWSFGVTSSGKTSLYYYPGSAASVVGGTTISQNAWHHIAVSGSNGAIQLYLDGTLDGSGTLSGNPSGTSSTMTVGQYNGNIFPGYIDDLRVTAGVARYSSNFSVPTAAFPNGASGGFVGIGTSSPQYTLHVVGNAGLSTGTAWTNASDLRLKDIHGDYEYGLDQILRLHTVRYSYKRDNALGIPSDHPMTGIIAQEVQKVIPDAIIKRKDGYLELNIDPIHWAVVNAIKDLYAKWFEDSTNLHNQINEKDLKIRQLEKENEAVKSYLCSKDPSAPFCR